MPARQPKKLNPPESDRSHVLDPFMPKDPLMAGAWASALYQAIGEPKMVAAFRADTGNRWVPSRKPLTLSIDATTGADTDFVREFAAWFNRNFWGDPP